jgi:hypothetical protein
MESMTSVQRPKTADECATLDEPGVPDRPLEVYCWRMERLLEAGYTLLVADALAQDPDVDVRRAVELLAARSPYEAAVRTLARWTQFAGDRLSRRALMRQAPGRGRLERAAGWRAARETSRPRPGRTAMAPFLRTPLGFPSRPAH